MPLIEVTLAYAKAPRQVLEHVLLLPSGSSVLDGLKAKPWKDLPVDLVELATWTCAIWGRKVGLSQKLQNGDRLELLRPLTVDPKVARRERFRQQGSRSAGLFANRRAGAKAGY